MIAAGVLVIIVEILVPRRTLTRPSFRERTQILRRRDDPSSREACHRRQARPPSRSQTKAGLPRPAADPAARPLLQLSFVLLRRGGPVPRRFVYDVFRPLVLSPVSMDQAGSLVPSLASLDQDELFAARGSMSRLIRRRVTLGTDTGEETSPFGEFEKALYF